MPRSYNLTVLSVVLSLLIANITAQSCPTITSTYRIGCTTKAGCGPERICDAFSVVTVPVPCNCPSPLPRTVVTPGCLTNSAGCPTRDCYTSYYHTNGCTTTTTTTNTPLRTTPSSTTYTTYTTATPISSPSPSPSISCPMMTVTVTAKPSVPTLPCRSNPGSSFSICTTATTMKYSSFCDLLQSVDVPCGCPVTPATTTVPCTTRCETLGCGTFFRTSRATNCGYGTTTCPMMTVTTLSPLETPCTRVASGGTYFFCTTYPSTPKLSSTCDLLQTVDVPCGCPATPATTTVPCTTRCETLGCGITFRAIPATSCGPTTTTTTTTTTSTKPPAVLHKWDQCGGIYWQGVGTCMAGTTCVYLNDWYSQCL